MKVEYEYFDPKPLTDEQIELIKKQEITIDQAKECIELERERCKDSDLNIFVRFKEDKIEDAKKLVFGESKIIVDIDDTEIQFVGTVINTDRNICDSINLLDSLEPYIENIFI